MDNPPLSASASIQVRQTATTTDDTPVFDRAKVSLDIPDELFGSSFSLVTNISKVVGSVIMVIEGVNSLITNKFEINDSYLIIHFGTKIL